MMWHTFQNRSSNKTAHPHTHPHTHPHVEGQKVNIGRAVLALKVLADPCTPASLHIAGHTAGVVLLQVRATAEKALLAKANEVVGVDHLEVCGCLVHPLLNSTQAFCDGVECGGACGWICKTTSTRTVPPTNTPTTRRTAQGTLVLCLVGRATQLIIQVPSKNGRVVLVSDAIDSVDTVDNPQHVVVQAITGTLVPPERVLPHRVEVTSGWVDVLLLEEQGSRIVAVSCQMHTYEYAPPTLFTPTHSHLPIGDPPTAASC